MMGKTLSEYRIIEQIGGGGMGDVYRAEDLQLKHTVALKFLPRELTRDSEARERFLNEARVAFSLDHANICTVHGIGESEEGQIFIVMTCYEGETLKDKIARGPLDPEDARSIFTQLASGLTYAHDRGVVHRDIKPANIMITPEGTVKILDFGLAKLGDQSKITRAGSTLGTVAYMSPEQARGEPAEASADVWAMGAVLYETLAGQAPFRGEYHDAIIYQILNTEQQDLSLVRPGLPGDLVSLCQSCLMKEKKDRPASARAVMGLLGAVPPRRMPVLFTLFRNLPERARIAILAVAAAGLIAGLYRIIKPAGKPGVRSIVAIQPFKNQTGVDSISEWTEALQSLVAQHFRELRILTYDAGSINEYRKSIAGFDLVAGDIGEYSALLDQGIHYVVDGTVRLGNPGYTLSMDVHDLMTTSTKLTDPVPIHDILAAEDAIHQLVPQIAEYLKQSGQSVEKTQDLVAWTSERRVNLQAHKDLMIACDYLYKLERGAGKYLRRAIEKDSMFVTPRIFLISGLMVSGKVDEAREHYAFLRRIEDQVPMFDQAMIDWCGALISGDENAQLRQLETALEYYPGNNILLYELARMKYLRNDWQGVITAIDPTVKMRWTHSGAYWLRAAADVHLGRYEEALETLEECIQYCPKVWYDNYGWMTVLYDRRGDSAKASLSRGHYEQEILKENDTAWYAYAELGSLYSEAGMPSKAIREYRRASMLDPTVPVCHDSLGALYYRAGLMDSARARYETLIGLVPEAPQPRYCLGRICEETNHADCAVEHYTRYLTMDSVSTTAGEVRRRLAGLNRE